MGAEPREWEVRVLDADPTSGLPEGCSTRRGFRQPSAQVLPVLIPGTLNQET